jgi:16S rRNA (guanine966-N2)-methyltransferase
VFAVLVDVIPGANVLDLFAGSGAVGLDAASRGAAAVTWVEQHAPTIQILKANIARIVNDSGGVQTSCIRSDVDAFLKRPHIGVPFDIVYADPPYALRDRESLAAAEVRAQKRLECLAANGFVTGGGICVIEQGDREAVAACAGWDLITTRTYGKTRVSIYRRASS